MIVPNKSPGGKQQQQQQEESAADNRYPTAGDRSLQLLLKQATARSKQEAGQAEEAAAAAHFLS